MKRIAYETGHGDTAECHAEPEPTCGCRTIEQLRADVKTYFAYSDAEAAELTDAEVEDDHYHMTRLIEMLRGYGVVGA
jgi:hypothetical protein